MEEQSSLQNLLARCRNGEATAFDLLFDRYKGQVYRVALALLRQREDAEDAVQDVFVGLLRSIATFDPNKGTFERWLNQVTVNHCRRKLRRPFLNLSLSHFWSRQEDDDSDFDLTDLAPHSLPDEIALDNDRSRLLWAMLNRLDERTRTVLVLRYYMDMSCGEIARTLAIKEGTVHSRLNAARRRLLDQLKQAGLISSENEAKPSRETISF